MNQNTNKHFYIDSHTHSLKVSDPTVMETICHPSSDASFSFGIHPWYIDKFNKTEIENLNRKLINFDVIGECGLDRCIKTNFDLQLVIFESHLKHASSYDKPCVIHCVKAESDLLRLRKTYKNRWFIHGFLGNSISMSQFLKINQHTWFGFGQHIFESEKVQKTLIECPLEHILLETDSQNKYKIEDIYQEVCKLKNISLEHLAQTIQNNHHKCFQII
ncbi:MAG: TatD family hydrolase [Candidatus Cloacimonetes bacterium]|nr:TatD family hydrolase [Candidatus Cloacimonadota bacterium]